jgi:histidinol phosphatase-like PHP family hydrolase
MPAADINALVGGLLRDLAFAQTTQPQMFGYKRAAAAVLSLESPLTELVAANGELPKIAGVGPASARVIREALESGGSPTVERAIDASGNRVDIERRRALRNNVLSRAEVLRVLRDSSLTGPTLAQYAGDLQMHSEWSDGSPTVEDIAHACQARNYSYAAVTDHSYGLKIAGGMSMQEAADQRLAIKRVNGAMESFRLLQGIEANIGADGHLDLTADEACAFDIVLAAPHSRLRRMDDQTERLITAVQNPVVRILAHPRGRIAGSRAGIVADWHRVFATAAAFGVAIEIDGDPARQDLDYSLAAAALASGCVFALDSDAHTTDQLTYVETAVAHARLAGIPADRVVNCWPIDRLLNWLADPQAEVRPTATAT